MARKVIFVAALALVGAVLLAVSLAPIENAHATPDKNVRCTNCHGLNALVSVTVTEDSPGNLSFAITGPPTSKQIGYGVFTPAGVKVGSGNGATGTFTVPSGGDFVFYAVNGGGNNAAYVSFTASAPPPTPTPTPVNTSQLNVSATQAGLLTFNYAINGPASTAQDFYWIFNASYSVVASGTGSTGTFVVPSGGAYQIFAVRGSDAAAAPFTATDAPTPTPTPIPNLPDFAPTGLTAPPTGLAGQSIQVTWTATNGGRADATGSWFDRIYLSSAPYVGFDSPMLANVQHSQPLVIGDSYTVTNQSVTLPNTAGSYYLIVSVDDGTQINELDEANNIASTRITIGAPDLTPTSFTVPATGVAGEPIQVSWTARNAGTGDALPLWYDRLYLSTDNVLSTDDSMLKYVAVSQGVSVGSSYTVTNQSVLLPTTPGSYYLIISLDDGNLRYELSETNNLQAVPISISSPDLVPVSLTTPASGVAGKSVQVSWTVSNTGIGDALPSWYDQLYLSTDNILSTDDSRLKLVTHSQAMSSGGSYSVLNQSVTLPSITGTFYLILNVDDANQVFEANEANNVATASIEVSAADLVPLTLAAPNSGEAGKSVQVSWTVANNGNGAALPSWYDQLYLSTDSTLSPDDTRLNLFSHGQAVAAGDSYGVSNQSVTLPTTPGTFYLILNVDDANQVYEASEANNVVAVPFSIGVPDLVAAALNAPSTGVAGKTIQVSWTVSNTGGGDSLPSWYDQLYLSTDSTPSPDDARLKLVNHTQVVPAGGSYTALNQSVTLPSITGTYYLILNVDDASQLYEADKTNNVLVAPITIQVPDLVPTSFTVPATGVAGKSLVVAWAVNNAGTGNALPSWTDRVYLSTDSTLSPDDTMLKSALQKQVVAGGGSYSVLNQSVTLPNITGTYYLILSIDDSLQVFEANETNNVLVAPITIQVPDLAPTSFTVPATGVAGKSLIVAWAVSNDGNGDALPSWYDQVYLSTDNVLSADDTRLKLLTHSQAVPAGGSYNALNQSITLPSITGTFYLVLNVDDTNQVYESTKANNVAMAPITIGVPDLVPTAFNVPASGQAGRSIQVNWTVANNGTGDALPSWYDQVYISSDSVLSVDDSRLRLLTHSQAVPAGGSYSTTNQSITLPTTAGSYYLILSVDDASQAFESNEGNNILVASITVSP